MTNEDKKYVKEVIDHFIDLYKLSLKPYYKAYQIWFDRGMTSEIVVDFLRAVSIPANIRIKKVSVLPSPMGTNLQTRGRIHIVEENGRPILFNSQSFRSHRFLIEIHEDSYKSFSVFITVLIHELAHLVLYSTHNRYRKSEVATDLFVICFGLFEYVESGGADNYITKEQVAFAKEYVSLKRQYASASKLGKMILDLRIKLL